MSGSPPARPARPGIVALSRLLSSGAISSEALTKEALERIDLRNPTLNAVVTVTADAALNAARRADQEIRAGRSRGALHGIPIGIKDVIDVRGAPTTMGSTFHQHNVAVRDATVVGRLRRAGTVLVGKLNTHEFAYGATGEDSFLGPTRNPHDVGRITGGSSGGPAAAVADGMCAGAIGTDTGGSVRIPAALCGLVGLKPTSGRVSRTGVAPLSWTLDHVGPITRSVADNAALFGVICGFDPLDSASTSKASEDFTRVLFNGVHGLRIGVAMPFFEHLAPDVRRCVDDALRAWEELGAALQPMDLPGLDRLLTAQRTVLSVEAYAVHRRTFEKRPEMYRPTVRQRMRHNSTLPAWQYAEALRLRDEARRAFDTALADVDILAAPAVAITAPPLGLRETTETGITEAVQSALTRLPAVTNLSGHPSLTIPCGRSRSGLPAGVQLIGRRWDEATLYRFGQALEECDMVTADARDERD
jgi:aspartyl-tRNA(Asn)/glutamyl-tRNA(Gln) amidotransferase subunit A